MITSRKNPGGFTLIELLIVIAIIGILAALSAVVMSGAATEAKVQKTKSQIERINLLLLERWESYETRPLQLTGAPGTNINLIQYRRLWAMRELMRMEMPDRYEDFMDTTSGTFRPMHFTPTTALQRRYVRSFVSGSPTIENESAECLYLILASIEDEFGSGLENFRPTEIGDTDNDGMNEILDAWGNPIQFIRWPAGYQSNVQPIILPNFPLSAAEQEKFVHDPTDPFHRDDRSAALNPFEPYLTYPLIFSAGPNEDYDGVNTYLDPTSASLVSAAPSNPPFPGFPAVPYPFDDPYVYDSGDTPVRQLGSILDTDELGTLNTTAIPTTSYKFGTLDNIDNHFGIQE